MEKMTGVPQHRIKRILRQSLNICLVSMLVCLAGCMQNIVSLPTLLDGKNHKGATSVPEEWRKYGACYLYDELFVESSYYSSSWISMPVNRIIYNKKLRILSKTGAAHGNIPIPIHSSSPREFRVTLTGPDGREVPLDNDRLRQEYLRKSAIVVPNVTEGCEIEVYVEYQTHSPITYHEFSFERSIPTLVSRYTFSALSRLHYEFKVYNMDIDTRVEQHKGAAPGYTYYYHCYELENVLPRPKLDFQGYEEDEARWVAVVLRRAMDRPVFTDWAGLAKNFRSVYLPTASSTMPVKKIRALVKAVQEVHTDTSAIADSLLQWTQENIVQNNGSLRGINISRTFKLRKGSYWEISLLLQQLYRVAGLPVDIVLTRSRELGGFDPLFVAPMSLSVPVVVVTVGGRKRVAFPFRRGGALGEYPDVFDGNEGLSMKKREPVALPPSTARDAGCATRFIIDCRDSVPHQKARMVLSGGYAYDTRTYLRAVEQKKHKEYVQKWLTGLGTSNALDSCTIDGLYHPGEPLVIYATFSNPNQIISKNGSKYIRLFTLFDTYYKSYDTLRQEPFVTVRSVHDTETVVVLGSNNRVTGTFTCTDLENPLFSVSCSRADRPDTATWQRVVQVNNVRLNRQEMLEVYPDILAMNRVSESGVVVSGATRRAKAHASRRRKRSKAAHR